MSAVDKPVVLYVDDEAGNLAAFNAAFRRDFDVRLAQSADEAIEALDQEQVKMILTGFADHDVVLAALNEGLVYRFFEKPWVPSTIVSEVQGAHELLKAYRRRKSQLLEMRDNLQRGVNSVDELLGHLSVQKDDLGLGLAKELKEILGGV